MSCFQFVLGNGVALRRLLRLAGVRRARFAMSSMANVCATSMRSAFPGRKVAMALRVLRNASTKTLGTTTVSIPVVVAIPPDAIILS